MDKQAVARKNRIGKKAVADELKSTCEWVKKWTNSCEWVKNRMGNKAVV